ncbi:MAG: hypothetical protein PHE20_00820 [Patescibacteria group bacterium]|nr:hypothetical protein [Patescibacteria group bacterium]
MFRPLSKLNSYFLKDFNPVIRFLILSDTVIVGASGLLGPIFAIFIDDYIVDADAIVVELKKMSAMTFFLSFLY